MADVKHLGSDHEAFYTNSGAALPNGAVVQLPDGRAGIVQGANGIAAGATGKVATRGRFRVNKLSTAAFSAGDVVEWDTADDEAKINTGGDFDIGVAEKAQISGDLTVDVLLNRT